MENQDTIIYDVKDIARILGIHPTTARRIFNRKDFPTFKIGNRFRVEKNAFEAWCAKQRLAKVEIEETEAAG